MNDGAKRAFKFTKNRNCCSKKVSQTASGRRAGCGLKKGMRPPCMAEGRITQDAVIEMPVRAAHALAAKPLLSNIENHNDDAAKRAFKFPKNRTCCNNATSMHLMIC
jgi:hypothetical protein